MEFSGEQIGLDCYDVLWETVMPGRPKPDVLDCDSPGATQAERGRIVRDASARLRRAGYLGPLGAPEEVGKLLDALERPRLAVDVRFFEWAWRVDGSSPVLEKWGARVALKGKTRAAAAVLGPTSFRSWSFPHTSLIDEVARLFPAVGPLKGFSGMYVPADQLRSGKAEGWRHLEGPFDRRVHITVLAIDPMVGSTRASGWLVLNDTPAGRFLVYPAVNQIAIAPATRGALEHKLKEMLGPTYL
jgi:hypothetical protein